MEKKKRIRRPPKVEYVSEVYSDDDLHLFPASDRMRFLVYRRRPPDDRGGFVKMPPASTPNVWAKYSVMILGYAEHTKNYYHSRVNKSFYDMLVVESGVLDVRFDGEKTAARRGQVLIIPPGRLCANFVRNVNTNVWWMHFPDTGYWREVFGEKTRVLRLNFFETFSALMKAYLNEAYSADACLGVLENIASGVIACVRRGFSPSVSAPRGGGRDAVAELVEKMSENPGADWRIKKQSQLLPLTAYSVDKYCKMKFGRSYSKCLLDKRMERALELVREGRLTNAEMAAATGYANAYSFSRAVSAYYGKCPRMLRGESEFFRR